MIINQKTLEELLNECPSQKIGFHRPKQYFVHLNELKKINLFYEQVFVYERRYRNDAFQSGYVFLNLKGKLYGFESFVERLHLYGEDQFIDLLNPCKIDEKTLFIVERQLNKSDGEAKLLTNNFLDKNINNKKLFNYLLENENSKIKFLFYKNQNKKLIK